MSNASEDPDDKFFMLECYGPEEEGFLDILEYPEIDGIDTWMDGSKFEAEVPHPIRLEWDPETSGQPLSLYDTNIPIFRKDALAALEESGVDNLDSYEVEIRNSKTGAVSSDYMAVNIIGLVAAADLEKSEYSDFWGTGIVDLDFDSLVIDPAKATDHLMFRLAERVVGVVIARRVKEHLESKGSFGLTFVPPEEWIG